ncbi:MAG: hypothetical protein IT170_07765, partial [Bryobacterales bacterium]|nr:hypothetical protein [Bryobacterales bacterium]
MELKVRRIGNSLGVILPKEILRALRVEEEGVILHATETADGIQFTPYNPDFEAGME